MLTCRELSERADDYIDGKLGFWSRMEVRMHLLACRYCRGFVSQTHAVVGLIRKSGHAPPPDETEQELLEAFRKRSGALNKPPRIDEERGQGSEVMDTIGRGMIAGFAATVALSGLMLVKSAMGLMPELDVIAMLSGMMGTGAVGGWLAHFMIGSVVWGGIFALIAPSLPGSSHLIKGVSFGVGAWLLMMVAVMPMAGSGPFGLGLGMAAPIMTLMLHAIFGAVLGGVYGALQHQGHEYAH